MSFKSEKEMSKHFKSFYKAIIKGTGKKCIEECKGLFGIPDYIIVEKEKDQLKNVVAYELKLKNWKRALVQAFRYKSFANQSFVVMDDNHIGNAIKCIDDFKRVKVGLASFNSEKNFTIHYTPENDSPFSSSYIDIIQKRIKKRNSTHKA